MHVVGSSVDCALSNGYFGFLLRLPCAVRPVHTSLLVTKVGVLEAWGTQAVWYERMLLCAGEPSLLTHLNDLWRRPLRWCPTQAVWEENWCLVVTSNDFAILVKANALILVARVKKKVIGHAV